MSTALNWKEIARLAHFLDQELKGSTLQKISVPNLAGEDHGTHDSKKSSLRSEWVLKFKPYGSKKFYYLYLSLQPQNTCIAGFDEKPWNDDDAATRSPFELKILQELEPLQVKKVHTVYADRILLIEFESLPSQKNKVTRILALYLIPAKPDAFLLSQSQTPDHYLLIAQFRDPNTKIKSVHLTAQKEREFSVRASIEKSLHEWSESVKLERSQRDLLEVQQRLSSALQEKIKKSKKLIEQGQKALETSNGSNEWNLKSQADLLKSELHNQPKLQKSGKHFYYELTDPKQGHGSVKIPADPKFSASEWVQRLFEKVKKTQTQQLEISTRLKDSADILEKCEQLLKKLNDIDFSQRTHALSVLKEVENSLGPAKKSKNAPATLGRSFLSKDGLRLMVGRNVNENLELTHHVARGNDLWFHVRGSSGAHVIAQLNKGKSAPLETLLDAATLAVYYTHGRDADKTEVDYTYKKNVRSIKGKKEVTYSQNKTILIDIDPVRLDRLLAQVL